MKKLRYSKILEFNPCYDPVKYIPKDWEGTLIDLLNIKEIPAKDRLWVVVRAVLLTDKQIHAYGLACARMCELNSNDPRVKACNDTVELFLKGESTLEQLNAAESAARSAAWSAARSARSARSAWSAAESARSAAESARSAWSAAESARSAARSARSAWSAAESARSAAESARSAARSARSAWSAAESARSARSAWSAAESARSAAESARSAARSAAEEKQCEILIEILKNKQLR